MSLLIGFIAAMLLVVFGIVYDPAVGVVMSTISNFIDAPSAAITFGGCIMVTVMSFPPRYFTAIPSHLRVIFRKNPYVIEEIIEKLVSFAHDARKNGMLSLEARAAQETDPFLKNSMMLIVDAIEPSKVREMLDNELNELENRHAHAWSFYEKFSSYGPAFGMIGTLIGLVNMLANLDMEVEGGATKMAQGMSVALITTFYGSMIANAVLMPIGHRLHMLHDEEMTYKEIVVQGVTGILAGDNPRHLQLQLEAFLEERQRGKPAKKKQKKQKQSTGK